MKNCILLLTCLNILFCSYSQNNNCSNTKRYEVEKGCLVYKVQTKRNSDKNWRTEKEIKISFSEYGKIQNHQILKYDSNNHINNNIDSTMDSGFFIDYFVKDKCSVFYKDISLVKPTEVYFKRKKAIKYVQFKFKDIYSACYLGGVTYYKGIPVLIDGYKYTCGKAIDYNNRECFYWKLISKLPSDVVK